MCSEPLPKEFEKTSDVLPFTKYGVSTLEEFKKAEETVHHLEWLKKVGLTNEEIKLYQDDVAGLLDQRQKIESGVLNSQLEAINKKINDYQNKAGSSDQCDNQPGTSKQGAVDILQRIHKKPVKFYPEGHPMHELKDIEDNLFGHLKDDNIIPITKRRKILRRLERKKERVLSQSIEVGTVPNVSKPPKPGSLWDVKEVPNGVKPETSKSNQIIGPKKQTMYTIKDDKIMRLEPVRQEERPDEYQAVDIVVPVNAAEEHLLEGTKMCVDDIKKIERFKDYEPGIPSKVLYLKNIAPAVTQEQLSLLFNQFVLDNGGPVDIRLMTGRMRGQAFVAFQNEDVAIQAMQEVNGTILSGRPVIAQFGRNSNRIDDR
ncbi:RNA-binding protein 41-like [Cydia strobilella]|uniref:RNA-binding protein 41-like n=1 Tax=Cydia strobilella TaxID=1100964 RepID=UPI0030056783